MLVDDTELDFEWLLLVGVEGGVYVLASLRDRVSISMVNVDLLAEVGEGGGVEQVIRDLWSVCCEASSGTASSVGDDEAFSRLECEGSGI